MKKLTFSLMLTLACIFAFNTSANATLIIICNGNDVSVHHDNDGCNNVEAYGCDFS